MQEPRAVQRLRPAAEKRKNTRFAMLPLFNIAHSWRYRAAIRSYTAFRMAAGAEQNRRNHILVPLD
jgi:hypothetical protein